MSLRAFVSSLTLVLVLIAGIAPTAAQNQVAANVIRLRRVSFDPLQALPAVARATGAVSGTTLRIIQFAAPLDRQAIQRLTERGIQVLAYVPDTAYLVRAAGGATGEWRWQGPFLPAYKLDAALDSALTNASPMQLTVLATPDALAETLVSEITVLDGRVLAQTIGAFGPQLTVELAGDAIPVVLARDDVLWVERVPVWQALNDQGRTTIGVDLARTQFPGLTGRGQVVAVADTGLDLQESVLSNTNRDFPATQIAQAKNMCRDGASWTDQIGHGSHVAGTIAGAGGYAPNRQFAGVAPDARLVVQSLALDGNAGLCFEPTALLSYAYGAGARVLNASLGYADSLSVYDATASAIDAFVWQNPEMLVVVAAGNSGVDCLPKGADNICERDGVIDQGSINAPGPAKNVLTVGATESVRPERAKPWNSFLAALEPIATDMDSNTIDGMAAFSSRGPTLDGRIKPEIVAPGVNIISSVSHSSSAAAGDPYAAFGLNYGYKSGTSMATPMVSGAAALVRQWLAEQRAMAAPSAALVKALLLNGATDIAPGQYGSGAQREIPAAWPNNVEGWGRANVAAAIGLGDTPLLVDNRVGLATGEQLSYPLQLGARQTMRATLAWSDRASLPPVQRALINNLDLELVDANGVVVARGNANAALPVDCRTEGHDRCNTVESIRFTAPQAGNYTLRVAAAVVMIDQSTQTQPFALVAASTAPALAPEALVAENPPATPTLFFHWNALPGATSYTVSLVADDGAATLLTTNDTKRVFVGPSGSYTVRVRGCNANGCGPESGAVNVRVSVAAQRRFLPVMRR